MYFMDLLFMVLCENMIGKSFLLPADIRKEIPYDHVYFFIARLCGLC